MAKAIDKLQGLMGKTVMYNTRNYKLLYFEKDGETVRIATDKKLLKFQNGQLEKFISELSEVDETSMEIYKSESHGIQAVAQMETILMENIEKVQNDPKYIPQAREVNKNVNSIITLARTRIQLVKMMEGKK